MQRAQVFGLAGGQGEQQAALPFRLADLPAHGGTVGSDQRQAQAAFSQQLRSPDALQQQAAGILRQAGPVIAVQKLVLRAGKGDLHGVRFRHGLNGVGKQVDQQPIQQGGVSHRGENVQAGGGLQPGVDRAGAAHRQLVKQLDRLVQLAQQFQGGGHTQHLQYGGRGSIGGVVTQAA